MAYTVQDARIASRIAYYDIDNDLLAAYGYDLSMREIFDQNPQILEGLQSDLSNAGNDIARARAQTALEDYNLIMQEESPYGDWIIRKVHDTNSSNGFYGCLIETSDSQAIIGFRGSESNDIQDKVTDWGMADLGLVDSKETLEQHEARLFMEEITQNTNYDEYATTGHSLGGNLALHAAIAAPQELQKKITQAISMDGPGFSDEYLEYYKEEIQRYKGDMTHVQWSVVGNLLKQPNGTTNIVAKVDENCASQNGFDLFRHDMGFLVLDENGNAVSGEVDKTAEILGRLAAEVESNGYRIPIVKNLLFVLQLLNMTAIWVTDQINQVQKMVKDIVDFFRQKNKRACFELSIPKAASSVSEYGRMIRTMESDKRRLEDLRKDSFYLKFGALPFQLALIYLEAKTDEMIRKMSKMKRTMGQVLNTYQSSENKVIAMTR